MYFLIVSSLYHSDSGSLMEAMLQGMRRQVFLLFLFVWLLLLGLSNFLIKSYVHPLMRRLWVIHLFEKRVKKRGQHKLERSDERGRMACHFCKYER
jgi:hypothetical protein